MRKIDLNNVTDRISLRDYSLSEIALHFGQLNGKVLMIKTSSEEVKIKFFNHQLPHLLGLQYGFKSHKNANSYKGDKGYNRLVNGQVDIKHFEKMVRASKEVVSSGRSISWQEILKRIEYLPAMVNLIISINFRIVKYDKERCVRTSIIKGSYLVFKYVKSEYLILSLKAIEDNYYALETFFSGDVLQYIVNQKELDITDSIWSR